MQNRSMLQSHNGRRHRNAADSFQICLQCKGIPIRIFRIQCCHYVLCEFIRACGGNNHHRRIVAALRLIFLICRISNCCVRIHHIACFFVEILDCRKGFRLAFVAADGRSHASRGSRTAFLRTGTGEAADVGGAFRRRIADGAAGVVGAGDAVGFGFALSCAQFERHFPNETRLRRLSLPA